MLEARQKSIKKAQGSDLSRSKKKMPRKESKSNPLSPLGFTSFQKEKTEKSKILSTNFTIQ